MRSFILLFPTALLLSSCLSYRDVINFQDAQGAGGIVQESIQNTMRIRLQTDDVVQVLIYSYANPLEAAKFNPIQASTGTGAQAQVGSSVAEPIGYRVDPDGNIVLPVAGKVQVQGLTLEEAQEAISEKVTATGYLLDNFVHLRFLSFRITILGEISSPGSYTIPSQRITLLEAIGMAGDLTHNANRDRLLIIREQNNKRYYGRVDLKSIKSLNSEFYNLYPGDILYVEPHRVKVQGQNPIGPFIAPLASIVTFVVVLLSLKT